MSKGIFQNNQNPRDKLEEANTNKDVFQSDSNFFREKIKERWAKLKDEDIAEIRGKRDQLLGKLQKIYGLAKEKAEKEISEWEKCCNGKHKANNQHSLSTNKNLKNKDSNTQKKESKTTTKRAVKL